MSEQLNQCKLDRAEFLKPFNGCIDAAAAAFGVTPNFLTQCFTGHKRWPIKRITTANEKYEIPLWVLRPDLYKKP